VADKRYCNGCIHAQFKAGVEARLAVRAGIKDALPYPTHICLLFGVRRRREKYDMRRLPICKRTKGSLYEEEVN
jgi:hypothetical protein